MSVNSAPQSPPARLNPFLFPSETKIHFVLLIISLLGVAVYAYLRIGLFVFRSPWGQAQAACLQNTAPLRPDPALESVDPQAWSDQFNGYLQALKDCDRPISLAQGGWMLTGVALLVGLAGLIYWNYPRYLKRRLRLQALDIEDAPEVLAELERLSKQAGLTRSPVFFWNPLDMTVSGQAFGRRGQKGIALTGGLVSQFYTDPPAFRAIVLHELAHLLNADVDISYFTVAVWNAFVLACIAPLALVMIVTAFFESLLLDFLIVLYMIPMVLLVYLTRNSVLRDREYYADLRVSEWDGRASAIERVLGFLQARSGSRRHMLWQVHPAPAERRQVLAEPQRLFRLGFGGAFGVGLATAVALPNLADLFNKLFSDRPDLTNSLPALLFAPFAMGIVGLGAYRLAFSRLMLGQPPARFSRTALGMALGIMFGLLISIGGAITQVGSLQSGSAPAPFGYYFFGFILTAMIAHWLLRWIGVCASAWLEVTTSPARLRWVSSLAIGWAALLFTIWSMLLIYMFNLADVALPLLLATMAALPLAGPLGIFNFLQDSTFVVWVALILLAGIWMLPLGAGFFRTQNTGPRDTGWVLLSAQPNQLAQVQPEKMRLPVAFLIGVGGGVALVGVMILIRLGLRVAFTETVRVSDQFRLAYFISQMLLSGLFQALAAGVSALFIRRLGAIHGLFSAFIAGLMGVAGFLVINLFAGGTLDLLLINQVTTAMLGWGFLFSTISARMTAGLAGLVRGEKSSPALHPTTISSG